MDINITHLMHRKNEMHYYSASQAELGKDAGNITWQNAKDHVEDSPLVTTEEQIAAVKEWFGEFGAWDDEEIAAWDSDEVNALLSQFIAGDIRERMYYEEQDRLDEYEETQGGRICENNDGEFFYYIGN